MLALSFINFIHIFLLPVFEVYLMDLYMSYMHFHKFQHSVTCKAEQVKNIIYEDISDSTNVLFCKEQQEMLIISTEVL